jgi:hypothetical protein
MAAEDIDLQMSVGKKMGELERNNPGWRLSQRCG